MNQSEKILITLVVVGFILGAILGYYAPRNIKSKIINCSEEDKWCEKSCETRYLQCVNKLVD